MQVKSWMNYNEPTIIINFSVWALGKKCKIINRELEKLGSVEKFSKKKK